MLTIDKLSRYTLSTHTDFALCCLVSQQCQGTAAFQGRTHLTLLCQSLLLFLVFPFTNLPFPSLPFLTPFLSPPKSRAKMYGERCELSRWDPRQSSRLQNHFWYYLELRKCADLNQNWGHFKLHWEDLLTAVAIGSDVCMAKVWGQDTGAKTSWR